MPRIYVCHTYYNVFVTLLKELNYQKTENDKGTIALSVISTDFKDLKIRLEKFGIFEKVIELNEIHPYNFTEKFKYDDIKGVYNPFRIFANWVLRWRYIAKQTEKYINIDFTTYKHIFVYCDSDPIGMYLNYKKIRYTAVEDGLESCRINKLENYVKLLRLKILLSKLGIMFMSDGHSKYAGELEVNDENGIYSYGRKVFGVSRSKLLENLNKKDKEIIYDIFYSGASVKKFFNDKKNAMLLTGQLCSSENSFNIYRDIIKSYCEGYNVYIKPHPIDNGDYENEFPNCIVLERFFPVEIFNIKCDLEIEKLISVTSVLDQHKFAKEKIRLGISFLNQYSYPDLLNQFGDINK